jgi:CRISPR-associated endonuclease/helicase Cas3
MLDDTPLPIEPAGRKGKRCWFTKDQVALVMRHTIPVPGTWLRGRSDDSDTPQAWAESPHLKDLVVVQVDGQPAQGRLGDRDVWLAADLGLSDFSPEAG